MEEILQKYPLLKDQNVPRETFIEFESFIDKLQKKMKKLTLSVKKLQKMR